MDDPGVVLSYHPVDVFLSQTNQTIYVSNQGVGDNINDVYDIIEKGGIAGASSVVVRRSACPEGGFDNRLPVVSDWLFYIEVALKGRVAKLDGVYGRYRKHGSGASERTYELLEESLATLRFIEEKYPNNQRLKKSCRKGSARYLAGEVYRQLFKDGVRAKSLADRMLLYCNDIKYVLLWAVVAFQGYFPKTRPLLLYVLGRMTYFIKRYFG